MKVVKKNMKEKGVSEVIGSILVLLITVVLFSSVFYYVSTMPTPKQSVYSEFDAQIVLVNANGQTYANITIKNVGGESLRTSVTKFIVLIESRVHTYYLSQGKIGSQEFAKDGKFSQGESFYYNSSWDGEPVTSSTNVYVMLYDVSNSKVIWSQRLQGQANLPPIVIGVMTQPSPIVIGKYGKVMAVVFDPDTQDDVSKYKVGVDLASLGEGSYVKMVYGGGYLFSTSYIYFNDQSLDPRKPYKITVYVEDNLGRNESYNFYVYITKGTEVSGPDIYIDSNLITLSTLNPTHHEDVTVTVTVQNRGGTGAQFKLEIYDIYRSYPDGELIKTSIGNPIPNGTNNYFTVAAAGQTTITFIWEDVGTNSTGASLGPVAGYHQLLIEAPKKYIRDVNGNPGEDPNAKYPNQAIVNLTVLPKILLVDADQSVEGTSNDVSRYYRYILDTCSYSYDTKAVLGEAVLTYNEYLKNYDLVIWETGYYGNSTSLDTSAISKTQMTQLGTFYDHGGALWIISPEIYPALLSQNFSINAGYSTYDGMIKGIANPDINLTLPNGTLVSDSLVNDRTSTPDKVSNVVYVNSGANPLIQGGTLTLGAYKENSKGGKLVYLGFEFSRIKHYYNQNFIGYRVLLWLGNLTGRAGVDVAVDDMILSTDHPLYMEPVNITVIVSNNGDSEVATQVMLKIDDVMSNDIVTANPNSTGIIPPDGGFVKVNFTWIPTVPGKHVLTVYADPYNVLKETNEENNILNGGVVDNVVYVEFSTLLIYNTTNENDNNLKTVKQAFDDLGYAYKELNVNGNNYPDGYGDGTYFTSYNLVVWVQTDDLSLTQNKIGTKDAEAIMKSLTYANIGFMFFGSRMPELMNDVSYTFEGTSQTLLQFFNVDMMDKSLSDNNKYAIFGVNTFGSPTNGLAYVINASSGDSDVDLLSGYSALFRDPLPVGSSLNAIQNAYITHNKSYEGYGVISKSIVNTKCAVIPIDPINIDGIVGMRYNKNDTPWQAPRQARAEIVFRMLKYFGQEDTRPELAVYEPDITIDYSQQVHELVVGHTYMLRTTIYNYGETGASTLIRFYEDEDWIGSRTVYIPGNKNVTVEIAWTPMFAGSARHIRVVLDPLNQVKEITTDSKELFNYNNEAILTKKIFFFWDNMEYGTSNWMHEATIMNINGESPIDYLGPGYTKTYTNVISDWDESMSKQLQETNQTFHSAPNSFWLEENASAGGPVTTKSTIPLDVVFVLDTSGSMAWDDNGNYVGATNPNSRWYQARVAAIHFIENLTDQDRASIWIFNGNGKPYHLDSFAYMTSANKKKFMNDLNTTATNNVGGGTPIYDTIGDAINDDITNCDPNDNSRLDVIVVLTDGADTTSTTYSPDRDWGDNGLLHAPPLIYTIGVVDTSDLHVSGDTYPTAADNPNWQPYYDTSTGSTNEYNLWKIANYSLWPPGKYGRDFNQSDYGYHAISDFYPNLFSIPNPHIGHYYFAEHANQIGNIFTQIRNIINSIASGGQAGTGNVTAPPPIPILRSNYNENSVRATTTVTYHMTSTQVTVNGLSNAYLLDTTQSSNGGYFSPGSTSGHVSGYWGIRAWIRHTDGTEIELTPGYPVAMVYRDSSGSGFQTATWTLTQTYQLQNGDSLVVRVYMRYGNPPTSSAYDGEVDFTTQKLSGYDEIQGSQWTIYYYTYLYQGYSIWSGQYTRMRFYAGSSTYDSRIEGISFHIAPPSVLEVYPSNDKVALTSQYVAVVFDESMDTSTTPTLTQTAGTDPGGWYFEGWFTTYQPDDTAIWSHDNWTQGDSITLQVSGYKSIYGDTGNDYSWSFTIIKLAQQSNTLPPGNSNKTAVTPEFDISNASSAYLTFWHKYNIVAGTNGAFIEIGYKDPNYADSTGWAWKYVIPTRGTYTGNLKIGVKRTDSFGNEITWAWNGISGGGSFTWDFVKVNLLKYVPPQYRNHVRIKFNYTQYGAGTGYGWYIDDVKVVVSREGDDASDINDNTMDVWQYVTTTDRYGNTTHAWWNGDPTTKYFRGGIDDSLITVPIDLTSAYTAILSAYFKFNINTSSGAPPDGFRVEVSTDNGVSWMAINLGVRSAWGVSGTNNSDDATYTGHDAGNNWVSANTLARLNVDLSAFSGDVILLRFRVVTTSASNYQHYDKDLGWGGLYVDDVSIWGESTAPVISGQYLFYAS